MSRAGIQSADKPLHRLSKRRGAVLVKAREWPRTEVFAVGPMVYFLYFDADDIMRDFVCIPS